MKTTRRPATHRGEPWSIIQPNSSGPMMPPMLKPVETMPNTRPIAPGGAARRTSMSREGWIMPKMTPESPMASTSGGTDSVRVATGKHDQRRQAEADGRNDAVAAGLVGQRHRPARPRAEPAR